MAIQAQALVDLTIWATVFRYPADDPTTAQPPPAKHEVEARLEEASAYLEAVATATAVLSPDA